MSDLNTPPFPFGENTCDNEVNTILAAAIKVAAENEMASVSNPNDFIPILPNSPYEDFLMNKVLDWEEQNSRDLTSFASNIMNEYYANSANTHWAQLPAEQSTSFDSSFPSSAFTATAPSFYSSSSSSSEAAYIGGRGSRRRSAGCGRRRWRHPRMPERLHGGFLLDVVGEFGG